MCDSMFIAFLYVKRIVGLKKKTKQKNPNQTKNLKKAS